MSGNHTFVGEGQRWPFSTGAGAEIDQKNAGERTWKVKVRANNIQEAMEKIELFRDGIESSPHVWMAPFHKIEQID